MNGRTAATVALIAGYLADGYTAKVQGGERYVERVFAVSYDDGPFRPEFVYAEKQPGIVLEHADERILFATTSRDAAEWLLERAYADIEGLVT